MAEAAVRPLQTFRPTPVRTGRAVAAARARPVQLGARYLGLLAASAGIVGLGFKSELLAPAQVWQATAGLIGFVTLGLVFLHARNRSPAWYSLDYYVTSFLAAIAAGGFSIFASDWKLHTAAMVGMAVVVYTSGYVDYCRGIGRARPLHRFLRDATTFVLLLALFFLVLQAQLPDPVKFVWIFAVSLLGGYRSFRLATRDEGRALFSAFVTAQVVTALAFGVVNYLNQGPRDVAVLLAFAWYANQGFIVHALEDSLDRRVLLEYGTFALISVFMVAMALVRGPSG